MTTSYHTMMDFEPPLMSCVVSNHNQSFGLLKEIRECVINIPKVEIAEKVANAYGRENRQVLAFRLTPVPASKVGPPLIEACYANLECRVAGHCLFVLKVIQA